MTAACKPSSEQDEERVCSDMWTKMAMGGSQAKGSHANHRLI